MKTSGLITRRHAIVAGWRRSEDSSLRDLKNLPPNYGNLLRMGDTLRYAAHRRCCRTNRSSRNTVTRTSRRFPRPAPPTRRDRKARSASNTVIR